MQYSENYSVAITGGKELGEGYVALAHEQEYAIQITNKTKGHSSIRIWIDGVDVCGGRGLIQSPESTDELERPFNQYRKFTFLKTNSWEAENTGIHEIKSADRGLIKVSIRPAQEEKTLHVSLDTSVYRGSTRGMESGGTALGNTSNQEIPTTNRRFTYEDNKEEVFYLRLVHDPQLTKSKKYTSLKSPNIPPPIN